MATCDCGNTTNRVRVLCESQDGTPLPQPWKTICPSCKPGEFPEEPFMTPFERKIWTGPEANPHLYHTRMDGTKVAKDELIADIAAQFAKPVDWAEKDQIEAAKDRKRRNRRTTPMTKAEIEQKDREWRATFTHE